MKYCAKAKGKLDELRRTGAGWSHSRILSEDEVLVPNIQGRGTPIMNGLDTPTKVMQKQNQNMVRYFVIPHPCQPPPPFPLPPSSPSFPFFIPFLSHYFVPPSPNRFLKSYFPPCFDVKDRRSPCLNSSSDTYFYRVEEEKNEDFRKLVSREIYFESSGTRSRSRKAL